MLTTSTSRYVSSSAIWSIPDAVELNPGTRGNSGFEIAKPSDYGLDVWSSIPGDVCSLHLACFLLNAFLFSTCIQFCVNTNRSFFVASLDKFGLCLLYDRMSRFERAGQDHEINLIYTIPDYVVVKSAWEQQCCKKWTL
jgi:hypothetical protein